MKSYITSINNYHDLQELWTKVKENAPFNVVFYEIRCKYCGSRDISKYGHYKNVQRWWCKHCRRKFTDNNASPRMKTPSNMVQLVVSMYYKGVPVITIRKQLLEEYNYYPSESIIHKWVYRDTEKTLAWACNHQPQVGDVWRVFESSIGIGTEKYWILDIVDLKTRFLLATTFSSGRTTEEFVALIEDAREKARKTPDEIIVKERYLRGLQLACGDGVRLAVPPAGREQLGFLKYWHFVKRIRRKVLSRQKLLASARLTLNGWMFYQNYVVVQKALMEKTAAQEAMIDYQYQDYKYDTGHRVEECRL